MQQPARREDDVEVAQQFLAMLAAYLLECWDRRAEEAASGGRITMTPDAYAPAPTVPPPGAQRAS